MQTPGCPGLLTQQVNSRTQKSAFNELCRQCLLGRSMNLAFRNSAFLSTDKGQTPCVNSNHIFQLLTICFFSVPSGRNIELTLIT